MKKFTIGLITIISTSTFAIGYKPPEGESKSVHLDIQATKEQILKVSK